jgi:sugar phosphate isomerase/epimerase
MMVRMISRRDFIASLSMLPAALASTENRIPANRRIKWALSSLVWNTLPPVPFARILDVMKETGFIGIRLAGFPHVLDQYGLTATQMQSEVSKRDLHVVTVSFNAPLEDPAQRHQVLESARSAMKFLADFGASHLMVFSPARTKPGTNSPGAFQELCARCNQIGELASELGFTAGLHNHMNQMVQTQEEVDRFMSMTDPKLFGLSPDTAHLELAGCDVVRTLERYKHRIKLLDYKDAKWITEGSIKSQPNGTVPSEAKSEEQILSSIHDLGDGEVDFPACHRVLRSVNYRGWICVDLDRAPLGPSGDFGRCGAYITKHLERIYA